MLPQAGGYAAFGGYGKLDDARGLKKRNPVARFLARHGASLSILLLLALGAGAAAHVRQARSCGALTQKLHHDIALLQNEHGHARASGDATAQQVAALQHQLDDARRELAAARAASAERDRRLAEAEAAAHGHAASAHGASAETEALRSRADTLALALAAAERERDEARHLLEAEKALHLKKEAEWKAAEAAGHHGKAGESYGGHQGDGDNDHTGFLQVAKLLEDQGVTHPQGHRAMASSLARFFEDQMAGALAAAERGEHVADVPVHDVSTKLISHLSHAGVASSHGVEHLFQTVDHLVDAALTHWRPPSASLAATQPHHHEEHGGHAAAAGHHEDPHAQQQQHHQEHHDPHAAEHHVDPHAQHHVDPHAQHHVDPHAQHHVDPHAQHHVDPHAAHHEDPHAAGHHDPHQQQHHEAAGHHGGHIDAHATGDPHHAPAADAHHHQQHHGHHKVDSSGFVM